MKKTFISAFLLAAILSSSASAQELIIGSEYVEPGIRFIFEGAVKDDVIPAGVHLPESQTDVHLEARVNWELDEEFSVPKGTPRGGFVAYLEITAEVTNESTGLVLRDIKILPHINLIDNLHYARNIKLPGSRADLYTVTFHLKPPKLASLALHKDWRDNHGKELFEEVSFTYRRVNFKEIAEASRR